MMNSDQQNPDLTADPWMHRSKGMKCRSCMFFVRKIIQNSYCTYIVNGVDVGSKGEEIPTKLGRCRRHAPTMNGYPVVYDSDWCGDHKVDENKVNL